jgi:hypothetical protein
VLEGARWYDPLAGQFVSPDTLLPGGGYDPLGLSRYAYVEGNPVERTDPSGHWSLGGIWSAVTHTVSRVVSVVRQVVSTAISWVSQAVQPAVQAVVSTARTVSSWVSSGVSRAASWVRARAPVYRAPTPVSRRPPPVSHSGVSQRCACVGPKPSDGESIPVEARGGEPKINLPIRLPTFAEGFSPDPGGIGLLIDPVPDPWDRIGIVFGKEGVPEGKAAPGRGDSQGQPKLPKPDWAPPGAVWHGPGEEGTSRGGWFDPVTQLSIHPHPDSPHHDPHYDVSRRGELGYTRVYPDGRPDEVVDN